MSPNGSHSPQPSVLRIDRVEWLSASPHAVLVRVHGHWLGPMRELDPVLLVGDPEQRHRFSPEPAQPGERAHDSWLVRFSVPIELRPRLDQGMALALGDEQIDLPAAVAGAAGALEAPPGEVFDRAVLAERRARRAELNEQALLARATAADAAADTLRSQLSNIEQRLQEAVGERERLHADLHARDVEAGRARQDEFAERRMRIEAEDRLEGVVRGNEGEVAELRSRLRSSERELALSQEELELARRAVAEARHAVVVERGALRRGADVAASSAPLGASAREVELEAELERRAGLAGRVQGELSALHAELERVRESAERQRERNIEAARMLEELAGTTEGLRDELARLERAKGEAELESERLRGELAEVRASGAAGAVGEAARGVEALPGVDAAPEREVELGRIVQELMDTALQLRSGFERELAALQEQLEAQVIGERERYAREIGSMEGRVDELRSQLAATAGTLRSELAAEQGARRQAEEALVLQRALTEHATGAADRVREELETLRAELDRERAGSPPSASGLQREAPPWGPLLSSGQPGDPGPSPPPGPPDLLAPAHAGDASPAEIADALEQAVARLRARAPALESEVYAPARGGAVQPPSESRQIDVGARVLPAEHPRPRPNWLAPAIARMAAERDPRLAGELVAELLKGQGLAARRPFAYGLTIEELGSFRVQWSGSGPAAVTPVSGEAALGDTEFRLDGPAAAFAALAAGGRERPRGIQVSGRRWRARRVLRARREPLALCDLAELGVAVWPGLVLAALAAAVPASWTSGASFTIRWSIAVEPPVDVYVIARDGNPVTVSREPSAGAPDASIVLTEGAFMSLVARVPGIEGESVTVSGDASMLSRFLGWSDRVQQLDG